MGTSRHPSTGFRQNAGQTGTLPEPIERFGSTALYKPRRLLSSSRPLFNPGGAKIRDDVGKRRPRSSDLVESVKMMNRAMAMPDMEAIRGGDRGGDVSFGAANRGRQILTLGQTGGDGG